MPRAKPDTAILLQTMAEHVLAHGLSTASLRPLAKAAGTSDRMLIYHFGSKEALIGQLLEHLADQMAAGLSAALPPGRAETVSGCAADLRALMTRPEFRPYSRLWLDIVGAAAQGDQKYAIAGQAVVDGFLGWLDNRLPDDLSDRSSTAHLVLTLIEGTLIMDAVGHSDTADGAIAAFANMPLRQTD